MSRYGGVNLRLVAKNDCCGCGACVQRCPVGCIALKEDAAGFGYPVVDVGKCIRCGACTDACPILHIRQSQPVVRCNVAKSKRNDLRRVSSSGGVFPELAHRILGMGGVVYGAAFSSDWSVVMQRADNHKGVKALFGSKYVQADVGESFKEAEKDLKEGRWVLYSGTPCLIAGFKNYLGKEYVKLLTVDFICHGVPSPGVWRTYLQEELQRCQCDSRLTAVRFRDKVLGWRKYCFVMEYGYGERVVRWLHWNNPFEKGFLGDLFLRSSCHVCKYRNLNSGSDITLGDFWRARSMCPKFYDELGVSIVLAKTTNGAKWLEGCGLAECDMEFSVVAQSNESLMCSPRRSDECKAFWSEYVRTGSAISLINKLIPDGFGHNRLRSLVGWLVYEIRRWL